MAISISKTREQYPLSPRKIIKKTITSSLGFVILYIFLLGILLGFNIFKGFLGTDASLKIPASWYNWPIIIGFILVLLNITWNYIYQVLYFNSYYYDLNESFIVIKKGVIAPREISIPYERVQDVYVDQDLWDRLFNIYDVHLSTATWTSGMEAHIDGVEKPAAEGLRGVLLKTISEKIHKKPAVTEQSPHASTN